MELFEIPASARPGANSDNGTTDNGAAPGIPADTDVKQNSAVAPAPTLVTLQPGSAGWIHAQVGKATICLSKGRWLVICPVCGDLLQVSPGRPRSALMASLRHHMRRRVFGLEWLQFKPGDVITVDNEKCEVMKGPYRPIRHHYFQTVSPHVFYLVVRRISDNRVMETSCRIPNKLEDRFTKSGKVRRQR